MIVEPSIKPVQEEKLRHKENTCEAILANEFFDDYKVEIVNPNHRTIYKQIKQHHPAIHQEHFRSGPSSEVIKPKFANPYKPRAVNVGGNIVREYMFTCLARNYSTKNLQQYFVSPEYELSNEYESTQKVRFIFAYNDKNELSVMAKATEKASEEDESGSSN